MTLPEPLGRELGRLVDRWRVLPVGQASAVLPAVHALLQELETDTAAVSGREAAPVPDLGPGPAMDQLTVLLQDWTATRPDAAATRRYASRLTALRDQTWGPSS